MGEGKVKALGTGLELEDCLSGTRGVWNSLRVIAKYRCVLTYMCLRFFSSLCDKIV